MYIVLVYWYLVVLSTRYLAPGMCYLLYTVSGAWYILVPGS